MSEFSVDTRTPEMTVDIAPAPEITVDVATAQALTIEHAAAGVPGRDAVDTVTVVTAGQAIGGHRVVAIGIDDLGWLALPETAVAQRPIGMSIGAAAQGAALSIQAAGFVEEPSWNWVAGQVFLGPAGTLTQMPPSTGNLVQVGVAAGPHRLRLNPFLIASRA